MAEEKLEKPKRTEYMNVPAAILDALRRSVKL